MKLAELFEDHITPRLLTQREFDDLPGPAPSNIEDRFRVGDVAFDAVNGYGAVPNSMNVNYLGFTAFMTPETFLKIAEPANRREDAERLAKLARERRPFGVPFLTLDFNHEEFERGELLRDRVIGHEGRGRSSALALVNGKQTMFPVSIFLNGLRARHLSERFFKELRESGIVPQGDGKKGSPMKVNLGRCIWMGKVV